MLYGLILTIHLFVCIILIAVILLQAGRGGGFADTFGGSSQSIFGTRGAEVLTKATSVCAAVFMTTSLTLAILSVQRGRSLMEGMDAHKVSPPKSVKALQPTASAPAEKAGEKKVEESQKAPAPEEPKPTAPAATEGSPGNP